MQEHARKERVFREELQNALDESQFRLNFQTFHPLDGGPAIGAESLLRWQHPTRGLLGPGAFLDSADRFGLMPRIGEWVARNAAEAAARSGCPLLSINVSPSELLQPGFAENFRQTCEAAGIPLQTMMVEITENTLLTSGPQALAALSALHSQGVRLALDDFGAGFAALSYLTWIPLNLVKVDRSLLHPPVGETSPAFLEGVVDLVHKVDALVLIEGVERQRELRLCREAGFDLVQGFLLAMPADEDSALAQFLGDTPAGNGARP
ncbi:MAG: EAL domain-containing protein [Candidatus Nanopelagicales bacterium]